MEKKVVKVRTFADREKANEYLHKNTSPENVGGLEAIASRTATLEGPERLLKVDLALSNGEHQLMWVEQGMVALNGLNADLRKQKQWQPTPRPTFPHYIVVCELITYETSPVTADEDAISLIDRTDISPPSPTMGLGVELDIEKLPLATFTVREMANEYAGKLFLEKLAVKKQFSEPADVSWWEHNALPEHRRAEIRASRPGCLYEASLETYDMCLRLGWNQIAVHVHEVDDVTGPVNF
ncbi:hypothetical protein F5Y19DRAFT_450776 [Xylariaceae sp. FL1651]|nr:hypothetical protein F5Y19DRAFT_450776 [Xylariaceae sp. FL1651]